MTRRLTLMQRISDTVALKLRSMRTYRCPECDTKARVCGVSSDEEWLVRLLTINHENHVSKEES